MRPPSKFVLCIRPADSEDLEVRKAAREGYLRIVDESGEDYLYPAECFAPEAAVSAVES